MTFLEELMKNTKNTVNMAADKAKSLTEQARLSIAIAGEQKEIDKNYHFIGEWFVNEYEGELPDAIRSLVNAVTASKAKIAELEAAKNTVKDTPLTVANAALKTCSICGTKSDSRFCPQCGAPLE